MGATLKFKKGSKSPYDLNNLEWVCNSCGKPILKDRWSLNPRKEYCKCNRKK